MKYRYPDGNEVVFVMFLFDAKADTDGKMAEDGSTLLYCDSESLQLKFMPLDQIQIEEINLVQKPVFQDLITGKSVELLRK